jgi:cytosine/adenosine deaminase-related metal-dependent hydrolase
MKRFSAQYIFTNTGSALKRAVITAEDDGTIVSISDTGGNLSEAESISFHNGIIIPGFVNCHCHLELSHLKGLIPAGTGLAGFLRGIGSLRDAETTEIESAIRKADEELLSGGIVLCADICNSANSFGIKTGSRIKYINLLEVFGIDPSKAAKRMDEIISLAGVAESLGIPHWIVPHTVYSVSLPLFALIREKTVANKITSIHYLESESELILIRDHAGPLTEFYRESGLLNREPLTVMDHATAILNEVTPSGNLLLVHNTVADRKAVKDLSSRRNLFWCLCPNSNLYIENRLPPLNILREEGCEIVIGTDSFASNNKLDILEELKTLQDNFPAVGLEELIKWATFNGANALGEAELFGSIEPGKRPGLILLQDIDLQNIKLLPESSVKRLL